MSDDRVLEWALREGRVLLTFDKDFGDLARTIKPTVGFGVILLRFSMGRLGDVIPQISKLIDSRNDWSGSFAVIGSDRLRLRRLR